MFHENDGEVKVAGAVMGPTKERASENKLNAQ